VRLSRHDIDYLIRMFELNNGNKLSDEVEQRAEILVAKLDGKAKQNAARLLLKRIIESFKIGV